jgi:hypothetical protein
MESWIRQAQKTLKGASVIWKAVIKSFSVIGNGLAWKVGNELRVRLGADPWMGSEGKHILSDHLIHSLRLKGLVSLNSLADQPSTTLWAQGWKSATDLDLNVEESAELKSYLTALKTSQIRLRDQEDELVWDRNDSGIYTPKEGYNHLIQDLVQAEPVWWWKKIWKVNCPAKSKLFWWSVLSNKAPTWDILQKRNFVGPGRCSLCKNEGETAQHLFLDCSYIRMVWTEVSSSLAKKFRWEGHTLEQAWRNWWENLSYKRYRILPLLIIWGVWLARNEAIFNEVSIAPEKTSLNSLAIFSSFAPSEGRTQDYRPIALCNLCYKIVTKIIARKDKTHSLTFSVRGTIGFSQGASDSGCHRYNTGVSS